MKTTELMIGDWVTVDGKVGIEINDTHSFETKKPKPIPLTAEILKKNFSSAPEWYFEGTTEYCLRIGAYKNAWCLYYERGGKVLNLQVKIDYVHELQHCLKICGIGNGRIRI